MAVRPPPLRKPAVCVFFLKKTLTQLPSGNDVGFPALMAASNDVGFTVLIAATVSEGQHRDRTQLRHRRTVF
jgi:hypothetical protein